MKTVLITGGSRGIGREMVKKFSEAGYAVAFTYRSSDGAAEELSRLTGALAIKADSRCEAEIIDAVKMVKEKIGNDVNIDVINDMSLEENACLIETENGVYNCGIDMVLSNLEKDIRSLL